MKPFRGKQKEFAGQFDDVREERRPKKSRKKLNEDEEMEFQSWMNRPSNVSDYLDDEEVHT